MKKVLPVLILLAALAAAGYWYKQSGLPVPEAKHVKNIAKRAFQEDQPEIPLKQLVDSLRNTGVEGKANILVDKSDATFTFKLGDTLVKIYPCVFGQDPDNDKRMEGDLCTPEGTFKVRAFYPHKEWHRFIWLNYPTADSWKKHKAAKKAGEIPQDARIGGEIGVHGCPEGFSNAYIDPGFHWTLGCVALKNRHVDEIYPYLFEGMQVKIIHPKPSTEGENN